MNRDESLGIIQERRAPWDLLIIGGGATGVGIAVDAAARGYGVLLLEQSDFGKGTSSRSTKLIHGGVRYLQQGNISLVMEALKERGILRLNAPHLVHDRAFVVPNYDWWETPFYGIGMKVYDLLAGKYGFGQSKILSLKDTLERIPTLKREGLRGGVIYYDGQFDDSRLLINLVRTAREQGAALVNYAQVTSFEKDSGGFITGATFLDIESGREHTVRAKVTINATGPFTDDVRQLDDPEVARMIAPSQGVHLVFDRSFLPGNSAIMVPHTKDGRVMFAIPWHGHTVVGTTDTPIEESSLEPSPMEEEIDFILDTASQYLAKEPSRDDILSVFTGIRPLAKAGEGISTATLSREHTVHIASSGLLSITGGKWTTYRSMAEDCVDQAATLAALESRPCATKELRIHGYYQNPEEFGDLGVYGADAPAIDELISSAGPLGERLHPALPIRAGEVLWAVRYEMARTVDDFLARRTRALFLNAAAARQMAPRVAELMATELGRNDAWRQAQLTAFEEIARKYCPAA
jgi:glycerol-3-phosphate dehydrogenase